MVVYYVLLAHQRWQLIKRKNIPRRLRFSVRASTAVQFYMIYLTNFHKKISKCKVEISRKLPMNMCALRDEPFELLTSLLPPSGQLEHERRPRGAEKLPTDQHVTLQREQTCSQPAARGRFASASPFMATVRGWMLIKLCLRVAKSHDWVKVKISCWNIYY